MKKTIKTEIIVKRIKRVPIDDFIALYKNAGWWKKKYDNDTRFINKAVKGSFCFVGAFLDKKMIGMGRALSDGCSDAYIQDVVVHSSFRGKGIGEKIVFTLKEKLSEAGVDWIALIAEPNTENFHSKNGFARMKGHTPMIWKGKTNPQNKKKKNE
jgi:spermidine synthase